MAYLPYPTYLPLSHLQRLPEYTFERPPFAPAERTRLHDFDGVTRFRGVFFVVYHELRGAPLRLAVETMTDLPLDRDHAAFLHLVADDDALLFGLRHHSVLT